MTTTSYAWSMRNFLAAGSALLSGIGLAGCGQSAPSAPAPSKMTVHGTVAVNAGPFGGGITYGTPCIGLPTVNAGDPVVVSASDGTILAKSTLPALAFAKANAPSVLGTYPVFGECDATVDVPGVRAGKGPYSIQIGTSTPQVFNQSELNDFRITVNEITNPGSG